MLTRDDLLAVLRPLPEARPLPPNAFTDPEVLELEERALFASAWRPVAHVADLAWPGDWVKAPVRGEHTIVVRTASLDLVALDATCTHRGTLLCDGHSGQLADLQIRCPYHAWTFDTEGALLSSPGRPRTADARGLARLRVETSAGGVVFVNLDPAAPALDMTDTGPPWLRGMNPLVRVRRQDHEVRANWKVLVGNFQESHHFPSVHPGLEARTPWTRSSSVVESERWLGGIMDLAEETETVSSSGQRRGRPFVAAEAHRRRVHDAWVFPLWLTSLQPDYLLTYRLAPLAVDRTLVVAEIHAHPGAQGRGADLDDVFAFWDRTNAEDRAICELQQRGLQSRHARPSCYATSEDGLQAFERVLARRYLRALFGEEAA